MRRMLLAWWLAACLCLCCGCVRLPGEERAFAVVLGIDRTSMGEWRCSARVPTYQEEGSYQTLVATGATPDAAMAYLDAAAPMRLHYGQLRLIVVSEEVAASGQLGTLLDLLCRRSDMRTDAQLTVSPDPPGDLLDEMHPKTGTRLSKSLDVLFESRQAQGVIPNVRVSTAVRLDGRQGLALPRLFRTEDGYDLRGIALFDREGRLSGMLDAGQTQLFMLLNGQMKKGTFLFEDLALEVLTFSGKPKVTKNAVDCALTVRVIPSQVNEQYLRTALYEALQHLHDAMQQADCDALGLARQTARLALTIPEWKQADWPARVLALPWNIQINIQTAAQ